MQPSPHRHLRRISLALLFTIGIIAWDQRQGLSSQSQPSLLSIASTISQHEQLLKVVTNRANQSAPVLQVAELDNQTQAQPNQLRPFQENQVALLELIARSARSRHVVRSEHLQ